MTSFVLIKVSNISVAAKGESFLATYSNDSKRSIEERFELMRNNKTNTNLQNVKI